MDLSFSRGQLKCDGTRADIRFRLSAKRTSPFKSAGASIQSTTGSRGVHISGSNVGYTMFRGSVKGTGYPLHSPVSPSLLPCVTMCNHISTGLYDLSNGKGVWIWIRIGTRGVHLWMRKWTFGFYKMWGISWLAENRLVSQVELYSIAYVSK